MLQIILKLLFKVLLMVVAALLLRGAVEREQLFILSGLVVLARGYFLCVEWRKPDASDPRWHELEMAHAEGWWIDEEEQAGREDTAPTETEINQTKARPEVRAALARLHARRTDRDIFSEAAGLVITMPGTLLLALMLTVPVVTWTGFDRGPAALALAAGAAMHFSVNMIPMNRPGRRIAVRAALMAAVMVAGLLLATARHPYLLKQGPDYRRMIAERVWQMGRTIEAGRYAAVLVEYARDLEEQRRWAEARTVYKRALELDAYDKRGHEGLSRVLVALGESKTEDAVAPLVTASDAMPSSEFAADGGQKADALPVFDWRPAHRLQICLVPVGDVSDGLLDAAGSRFARVVGADVYRWAESFPLPESDRRAGLLGSVQWLPETIMNRFLAKVRDEEARGRRIIGTWQFLIVTSGDLYMPDANYVFAASYPVHGMVSIARLSGDGGPKCEERLVKQLTATAIKCFGVTPAIRPECVTAYVRSLDELDRKSSRPVEATWVEYRRRVERWERDPSIGVEPPR